MLLSRVWTIDPVMMQAEHELIAILPHFQIRENSGVLNFIGVRIFLERKLGSGCVRTAPCELVVALSSSGCVCRAILDRSNPGSQRKCRCGWRLCSSS